MPKVLKRILTWVFWLFVIYAIFKSPDLAADLLRGAWNILVRGFESLIAFFDGLLKR